MTLTHYELNPQKGKTVLFVGDLSYADNYTNHDNVRWDTWGRFVERSVAYQPWIWTAGNHELDFEPKIVRLQWNISMFGRKMSIVKHKSVLQFSVLTSGYTCWTTFFV
jgi:hypothetical protein